MVFQLTFRDRMIISFFLKFPCLEWTWIWNNCRLIGSCLYSLGVCFWECYHHCIYPEFLQKLSAYNAMLPCWRGFCVNLTPGPIWHSTLWVFGPKFVDPKLTRLLSFASFFFHTLSNCPLCTFGVNLEGWIYEVGTVRFLFLIFSFLYLREGHSRAIFPQKAARYYFLTKDFASQPIFQQHCQWTRNCQPIFK